MASTTPRCPCCQQQQRPLYCAGCLQEGIALHDENLRAIQSEIDAVIQRSRHLLEGAGPSSPTAESSSSCSGRGVLAWRELRADVAARERRCAALRQKAFASVRQRSQELRSEITRRRATLNTARSAPSPAFKFSNAIKRCKVQQQVTASHIVHARRVLVREAVAVFGVRKRTSGDWEIAGLILPSPDAFRLYPSANINAGLTHTVHLLSLITSYLAISLPFVPTPPPPLEKAHIGRPIMRANLPFVGTTKWRDKHVLWMSSTASVSSKMKSRMSLSSSRILTRPNVSAIIVKSTYKHRQFLTSFALLAFSIAYLAWSQNVPGIGIRDQDDYHDDSDDEAPRRPGPHKKGNSSPSSVLISATSVLELISALAASPSVGRRTHEPGTDHVLKHLGFGLDVAKVVQTVLSSEENRWGTKPDEGSGEDLSEGWDLLDAEDA
ncbi:hypothetical protein IAU60_001098 [Kwoniella sp. DSM 27419]